MARWPLMASTPVLVAYPHAGRVMFHRSLQHNPGQERDSGKLILSSDFHCCKSGALCVLVFSFLDGFWLIPGLDVGGEEVCLFSCGGQACSSAGAGAISTLSCLVSWQHLLKAGLGFLGFPEVPFSRLTSKCDYSTLLSRQGRRLEGVWGCETFCNVS